MSLLSSLFKSGTRRFRRSWFDAPVGALEARILLFADPHPEPDNGFGSQNWQLANGNMVITAPYDDAGGIDAGAVYLFNADGVLISTLTGSSAYDHIGLQGLRIINGNTLLMSCPDWDNGAAVDAGAVTLLNGTTGVSGVVSAANSLVGKTSGDRIGADDATYFGQAIFVLSSGNYVVLSPGWDNGTAVNAGAMSWGSATNGVTGEISASNSLIGTTAFDQVGRFGLLLLNNGNFVIQTPGWNDGTATGVNAITWVSGTAGLSGAISPSNSLIDPSSAGLFDLPSGDYMVLSEQWDNGSISNAGAVTWGSGTSGVTGYVSAANSLVGSTTDEYLGHFGYSLLSNGNFLVWDPYYDNGSAEGAGAITFGNAATGVRGVVSPANSLVGSSTGDLWIYSTSLTELNNGSYVVSSPEWDNGAAVDAGAVTFGNATTGVSGVIGPAISLVGTAANDRVGSGGVVSLGSPPAAAARVQSPASANPAPAVPGYAISSPLWDNGSAVDAGAITWGSSTSGVTGPITRLNSLRGQSSGLNLSWNSVNLSAKTFEVTYLDILGNTVVANFPLGTVKPAPNSSYVFKSGKLSITGSAANDHITFVQTGGTIKILDGISIIDTGVAPRNLKNVKIQGLNGDDVLVIDLSVSKDVATEIEGGKGNDYLVGGAGPDELSGDDGSDTLSGRGGDDTLEGGDGSDNLIGGDGNDTLEGDAGDDRLNGGAGNDDINGGAGSDTVTYETATSGVYVNLTTNRATGGGGSDRLAQIENIVGSNFSDVLIGNRHNNIIFAGGGGAVDIIDGRGGMDIIIP